LVVNNLAILLSITYQEKGSLAHVGGLQNRHEHIRLTSAIFNAGYAMFAEVL